VDRLDRFQSLGVEDPACIGLRHWILKLALSNKWASRLINVGMFLRIAHVDCPRVLRSSIESSFDMSKVSQYSLLE
jgi:hypothetical protein